MEIVVIKKGLYMSTISNYKGPVPEECPICLDQSEDTFVAHNDGQLHPLHKKCLSKWTIQNIDNPTCPLCRCLINPEGIFSKAEILNYQGLPAPNVERYCFISIFSGITLMLAGQCFDSLPVACVGASIAFATAAYFSTEMARLYYPRNNTKRYVAAAIGLGFVLASTTLDPRNA
jgi:hypothetical protein